MIAVAALPPERLTELSRTVPVEERTALAEPPPDGPDTIQPKEIKP